MSSAAAIYCSLIAVLPGHLLPDGFVERGVDVTVSPDRLEVCYRLGLSDGQMRPELSRFGDQVAANSDPETAWARFRELIASEVVRGLAVRVNGEMQPLRLEAVEPWVKHHVSLQVILAVDIDVGAGPMGVDIRDELPVGPDVQGVTRLALRGRRDLRVIESNVPANLVRAERMPIVTSGDDRIPTNCRIAARVGLAADGHQNDEVSDGKADQADALPVDAGTPSIEEDESDAVNEEANAGLSPEAAFWLATAGLVSIALGILLVIRQQKSPK